MDQNEIYEMVIREKTETALSQHRDTCSESEQELYLKVRKLSEQVKDVLQNLPEADQQVLEDYFTKTSLIADHECTYLYVQGAKDGVALLKNLGVF